MSFTVQSKSQLAKLMATENIAIQHIKAQTASFDPMKRILYLPIWTDMSGAIYDLLTGHEVGHAQYTPAEGWHSAATDKTKSRGYKGFLNVVEDARIEKKIQRKYPGLRMSFKNAYKELMNRDFFGIKDVDVETLPFIDRLNLYSKSQWTMDFSFNEKETELVQKVRNAESWEDVVKVTDEIFEYSKSEQQEIQMRDFEINFDSPNDDEIDSDSDTENKIEQNSSDDNEEESESSQKNDGEDEQDEEENSVEEMISRRKKSADAYEDQFIPSDPVCETDENYRRNESLLLDEKSKDYAYFNIPKCNLENVIVPHNVVHSLLNKSFKDQNATDADRNELFSQFKKVNERYINLLVKEFEMRKAAKSFNRSRLADTGEIDVGKLASYKFDDNLFRKMLLVPKGKSHGLVLLLDKSGSMQDIIGNSIEQILILTMFCRKVNIPFSVYGFGNYATGYIEDLKELNPNIDAKQINLGNHNSFNKESNDLLFSNVRLREYLSSNMSNSVFTNAVKNMLLLKVAYARRSKFFYPISEGLSNTPLTQAIVAMADVMKQFKQKNNLDITNLVIVHDGDADWIDEWVNDDTTKRFSGNIPYILKNCFIVDKKNKFQYKITEKDSVIVGILEWYKQVTGSKVFSFYLANSSSSAKATIREKGRDEENKPVALNMEQVGELAKRFTKENYVALKVEGFDEFFITKPVDFNENDSFYSLTENAVSMKEIKSAFAASNKKRNISRAMVNQFVSGIAA
jgi:hypothetical protein